jgi:hypothetical protein
LADLCGLTRQALQKAALEVFPQAVVGRGIGSRVDAAHPDVIRWLLDRGVDPTLLRIADYREADGGLPPEAFDDMAEFLKRPFGELIAEFGSARGIESYLKRRRASSAAAKVELETQTKQGTLISRSLVSKFLFAYLEHVNRRLLNDVPRTLARATTAKINANEPLEAVENVIRDQVGSILTDTRSQLEKKLRSVGKLSKAEATT